VSTVIVASGTGVAWHPSLPFTVKLWPKGIKALVALRPLMLRMMLGPEHGAPLAMRASFPLLEPWLPLAG
jgi:hypothetical protein